MRCVYDEAVGYARPLLRGPEGGSEYASYHHVAEDSEEEAHLEPAVLQQQVGEASEAMSFEGDWSRISIEYGSRCEQYSGHWEGHGCAGVRNHGGSPLGDFERRRFRRLGARTNWVVGGDDCSWCQGSPTHTRLARWRRLVSDHCTRKRRRSGIGTALSC
jgi:hypothetical protein